MRRYIKTWNIHTYIHPLYTLGWFKTNYVYKAFSCVRTLYKTLTKWLRHVSHMWFELNEYCKFDHTHLQGHFTSDTYCLLLDHIYCLTLQQSCTHSHDKKLRQYNIYEHANIYSAIYCIIYILGQQQLLMVCCTKADHVTLVTWPSSLVIVTFHWILLQSRTSFSSLFSEGFRSSTDVGPTRHPFNNPPPSLQRA